MSLMLAMALVIGVNPSANLDGLKCDSAVTAAREMAPALQTGTLLVTKGDCLAVQVYTQSPFTHVAVVVVRNTRPLVYESANGIGARCLSLEKYLGTQNQHEVHVFQPRTELSDVSKHKLEVYLDSQLGRPYEVQHFLTGDPSTGMHCSEYVTNGLIQSGLLKAKQPARVSPASLVQGITQSEVYAAKQTILIQLPEASRTQTSTWYGQLWQQTKNCTADCYQQTKGCLFCK